jgi:kinesin family member 2/24
MSQVTKFAVQELYQLAGQTAGGACTFQMSFFEIYGGKVMDLLNGKKKLQILEDKFQRIQVQGLEEKEARSGQEMLDIINYGHSIRTTH